MESPRPSLRDVDDPPTDEINPPPGLNINATDIERDQEDELDGALTPNLMDKTHDFERFETNKFATDAARPPEPDEQTLCELDCELLSVSENNIALLQQAGYRYRTHGDVVVLPAPHTTHQEAALIKIKERFTWKKVWTKICDVFARFIVFLLIDLMRMVRQSNEEEMESEEARKTEALSSPLPTRQANKTGNRSGNESDDEDGNGVANKAMREQTQTSRGLMLTLSDHLLSWLLPKKWYRRFIKAADASNSHPVSSVTCFALHPNHDLFCVALTDDTVHCYSLKTGQWSPLVLCHALQTEISSLAWQPNSSGALAVTCKEGVCFWRIVESAATAGTASANGSSRARPVLQSLQSVNAGVSMNMNMSMNVNLNLSSRHTRQRQQYGGGVDEGEGMHVNGSSLRFYQPGRAGRHGVQIPAANPTDAIPSSVSGARRENEATSISTPVHTSVPASTSTSASASAARRALPFTPQSPINQINQPPVTAWRDNLARTSTVINSTTAASTKSSAVPAVSAVPMSEMSGSVMGALSGVPVARGVEGTRLKDGMLRLFKSSIEVKPPKFVTSGVHAAFLTLVRPNGSSEVVCENDAQEPTHKPINAAHAYTSVFGGVLYDRLCGELFGSVGECEGASHIFELMESSSVLSWSPDGRWLAIGGNDGRLSLWDSTMEVTTVLQHRSTGISLLRWSPNGQYLFSGTAGRSARIWSAANWSWESWNLGNGCQDAVWSPDSSTLLVAPSDGGLLHVLRLDSALQMQSVSARLIGTQDLTTCVTWSQSGLQHIVGGKLKCMTWDSVGERLAISFDGTHRGSELIALFATRVDVVFDMVLLGFLRGPPGSSSPLHLEFKRNPNSNGGSGAEPQRETDVLAALWDSRDGDCESDTLITPTRICFIPLCFRQ